MSRWKRKEIGNTNVYFNADWIIFRRGGKWYLQHNVKPGIHGKFTFVRAAKRHAAALTKEWSNA